MAEENRDSDADHLIQRQALELEKLRAEVALARSQVTFLGQFSRLMWPMITSAVKSFASDRSSPAKHSMFLPEISATSPPHAFQISG